MVYNSENHGAIPKIWNFDLLWKTMCFTINLRWKLWYSKKNYYTIYRKI